MKNYLCFTCQEPMKISVFFHSFIRSNGPTNQKCMACGAVHTIDGQNRITLSIAGARAATLSPIFPYPEHKPYRVGPYRVQYENGNWARMPVTWNGDAWHNGPILFHAGSIIAWQGLGGDMEHMKRWQQAFDMLPIPAERVEYNIDEDGLDNGYY